MVEQSRSTRSCSSDSNASFSNIENITPRGVSEESRTKTTVRCIENRSKLQSISKQSFLKPANHGERKKLLDSHERESGDALKKISDARSVSGGVLERTNQMLERKKKLAEQKEKQEKEELRALSAVRFVNEASRRMLEADSSNVVERSHQLLEKKKRLQEERDEMEKQQRAALSASSKMDKGSRKIIERRGNSSVTRSESSDKVLEFPPRKTACDHNPLRHSLSANDFPGSYSAKVHGKGKVDDHVSGLSKAQPALAMIPASPEDQDSSFIRRKNSAKETSTITKEALVARLKATEHEIEKLRHICVNALRPIRSSAKSTTEQQFEKLAAELEDKNASEDSVKALAAKHVDTLIELMGSKMPLSMAKIFLIQQIERSSSFHATKAENPEDDLRGEF